MIPDILGYKLEDAESLLRNYGYDVSIVISKPQRGNPEGLKRVVKFESKSSNTVVLTVVCEEKGKGGVHNGL